MESQSKISILFLTLIAASSSAYSAINGSDDFDDNSKDTTKWGVPYTSSNAVLSETNAQIEYTTIKSDYRISAWPWIRNQATYDSDWEIIVNVRNTFSYASGGNYRDFGVGFIITPPANTAISYYTSMDAYRDDNYFKGFSSGRGDDEDGDYEQQHASSSQSAALKVSFNSTTKVLTSYYDDDGAANGYSWTLYASMGVNGSGGTDNTSWGMSGSQAFDIYIGGNSEGGSVASGQLTLDDFSAKTPGSLSLLQTWQTLYFTGPSNPDSALSQDPDHDGLCNALEYAFNLNPNQANTAVLTPVIGTSGVPNIQGIGTGATLRLKIEYLRRKASSNPGITYTPQFSSDLEASWQDFSGTEALQSIHDDWERVRVEEVATGKTKRFARVKVITN